MEGIYIAYEFETETCRLTGRTEYYMAANRKDAVAKVLYSKRLHNGYARVGPTGRVVCDGRYSYVVVRDKR